MLASFDDLGRLDVLVHGDDPLLADGIASMLVAAGALAARPAPSLAAAVVAIRAGTADVLVIACDYADSELLHAACQIGEGGAGAALVLARSVDQAALRAAYAMGVRNLAVLLRDGLQPADLARAVALVAQGTIVTTPLLLEQLMSDLPAGRRADLSRLTNREHRVLQLMSLGLRNCGIAERMGRTETVVEKHISGIFEKLGLVRAGTPYDRRVKACRVYLLAVAENGSHQPQGL
jgi:DNA-binding NarL/FixJ family response regulator